MSDFVNYPSNGRWIWNDNTNGLEFLSANVSTDKQDKKYKEKQHQQKDNRSSSCAYGRQTGQVKAMGQKSPARQSMRQVIRQSHDHRTVTLQDVKDIAKFMLLEIEPVPPAFEKIYSSLQLDEFLVLLLNYFHYFFERLARESHPNPVHIETSLAEKRYLAQMKVKLDGAQKQLGRAYGVLILGIGMCDEHHMACGKSRVSNTYKDRSMYETLYSFATFVVWIAFRRQEHDIIKKEINRMLRTDTFNPALRIKNSDGGEEDGEVRLTPAEYRRTQGNRPPIKSIVNQRSVALVSILPLPREEADWLFKRSHILSSKSAAHTGKEELTAEQMEMEFRHLNFDMNSLNVGIIGRPLDQFNLLTLAPLEEEFSDGKGSIQKELPGVLVAVDSPSGGSSSEVSSRQGTMVSVEATEDLHYSDNDKDN